MSAFHITGRCLEPMTFTGRVFLDRVKLPSGKVVNLYRAKQKHSMNEWHFYYYRGRRYLVTVEDYSNSTVVNY